MLINIIIALLVAGAVLFIVPRLPIDGTIKTIIQVVVVVALCIYLLRVFGGTLGLG